VINLAIRDEFDAMDDALIRLLTDRAGPHLEQGKRR